MLTRSKPTVMVSSPQEVGILKGVIIMDLTLEEKREIESLAIEAADDIMVLKVKFAKDVEATIKALEEELGQGVCDGDWEANLDCLEDTLTARIRNQFECM